MMWLRVHGAWLTCAEIQSALIEMHGRGRYITAGYNKKRMRPMQSDHFGSRGMSQTAALPLPLNAAHYTPYLLTILRIVVALLFFEHGTSRLFGFPSPLPAPEFLSMLWFAGAIELIGGALLALGLFTRPVAFIMSGEMAIAYFLAHAPTGFFPIINRGDSAILYCFVFFYLAFAGPGPWSLDAALRRTQDQGARRQS
jgi:putative oxidoreductase